MPVVTGLLREQLGFTGLIVSDAMNMNAVTAMGTAGQNAVKAFLAGIDLILDSRDTMDAFRGLKAAVESGQIPRARLEASVRRDTHGEGAPRSAPFTHGQPRAAARRWSARGVTRRSRSR